MTKKFNNRLADAQATQVTPVKSEAFDFPEYEAYAAALNEGCARFWQQSSGVAVYRRMRVGECFSYGCRDMTRSLELQLGALQKSMLFKADVPNFLEPWYGIGTVASAFGGDYIWVEGNAPALKPRFSTIDEVLAYEPQEISQTLIGRYTLDMIDYFMEQTQGRLPISLTDTQSPLNMIGHLYPLDQFFMDMLLEPDKVSQLFDILADLSISFNQEQLKLIGPALASPGHGFASSTKWTGLGMSDDNAIMISPDQYLELAAPSVEKICTPLGGPVFHSCGDWSGWVEAVLQIKGLKMADGAFSPQTDPGATSNLEAFHRFAHSGIVLNARIVGDLETIREQVSRLWVPGMKLVVVTYCETPAEQEEAYDLIHQICR
ncbi:uroporphyrinogen decarboxylase family protein [Gaoshiqia sediminis]|uniref:Uroporphyrinogen decarboxylase family protein n=1 Tax=Gaoshiqia sediminis TaxID=2986998 RepID=A0AA42C991_9BACT|nr:uroporphyrinogen decarboxylase family protein [Gaoshiqia sediminis]MCW0481820.1 uroporphyrinogen decarboxylase family protein [Gaoshiqia sediminis]